MEMRLLQDTQYTGDPQYTNNRVGSLISDGCNPPPKHLDPPPPVTSRKQRYRSEPPRIHKSPHSRPSSRIFVTEMWILRITDQGTGGAHLYKGASPTLLVLLELS